MKKIMFYINTISGGGAARVMVQLANNFCQDGYKVYFVTSFMAESEYILSENIIRISLEDEQIIQSKIKRNINRIIKLRNLCKKYKPNILVSFMIEANTRAIISTLGLKTKVLTSVRNDPKIEHSGIIGHVIGKFVLPLSDHCVFQTNDAYKWATKKLKKKSSIIKNQVSREFFSGMRENEGNNIVTFGRLVSQKNHKLLIRAFYSIEKYFPDDKLLIYGEGELREELKKIIKKLGLENRVFLMGKTNNVLEILEKSKIFVLSSNYEGMPNALMEAMAVGLPSISTDCPCGGPRELIENYIDGILVPIKNVSELSEAMFKLLKDHNLRKKISINSKKKSLKFEPNIIYNEWKSTIEKMI